MTEAQSVSPKVPPEIMLRVQEAMSKLESSLLAADPDMPNHLRESHKLLVTYGDVASLLSDAQIHTLIQAAEIWTDTKITTTKEKSTKAATNRISKMSADDI